MPFFGGMVLPTAQRQAAGPRCPGIIAYFKEHLSSPATQMSVSDRVWAPGTGLAQRQLW